MFTRRSFNELYLVWLIIGLSCIPFLILRRHGLDAIADWFVPANPQELFSPFSLWRLWTPTFVHYTLPHLLTNLYLWWLFAAKIERESRLELILVVAVCAAGSNAFQWWFSGPDFGGLSGVVYGLLSYMYVLNRFAGKRHYHIEANLIWLMLALIPLSASGLLGNFADYAHIGGLICGGLIAFIYLIRYNYIKLN